MVETTELMDEKNPILLLFLCFKDY